MANNSMTKKDSLSDHEILRFRQEYRLTEMQTILLNAFLTNPIVTEDLLRDKYGINRNHQVFIHRLRLKLTPKGVNIQSMRSLGYWISPEDKRAMFELTKELAD